MRTACIFAIIAILGITSSMVCLAVAGLTNISIFGEGAIVILVLTLFIVAVWFISLLLRWMHDDQMGA